MENLRSPSRYLLALALCLAACENDHPLDRVPQYCTLVGCVSRIKLRTVGSEWSEGTIVAEDKAHFFVCNKRGQASRRIGCAPFDVYFTLPRNLPPPSRIGLTITGLANNVRWQSDILPQYDITYPNGKQCDRVGCSHATLEIPLGGLVKDEATLRVDDAGVAGGHDGH